MKGDTFESDKNLNDPVNDPGDLIVFSPETLGLDLLCRYINLDEVDGLHQLNSSRHYYYYNAYFVPYFFELYGTLKNSTR